MLRRILGAAAVAALLAGPAVAAPVVSLVGDIDGFGGQTAPGAVDVFADFFFDNRAGSDPSFTDVWQFQENGGQAGSPTWNHVYALGSAVSAELEIMETGMSDNRGPWNVLFNGNFLGVMGIQPNLSNSRLLTFNVDVGFLTGNDTVQLVYQDTMVEGYAIDYAQLTVNDVPVPAAGLLLLGGIGLIAGLGTRSARAQ